MSDEKVFSKVVKISAEIMEDIYCGSKSYNENDTSYWEFLGKDFYKSGDVIKKFANDDYEKTPKMFIWDWNGDQSLKIPKTRFLLIRGTHTSYEWEGNFDFETKTGDEIGLNISGYFHNNFGKVGLMVYNMVEEYIKNISMPLVIVGHSRGASISQVVTILAKSKLPADQEIYDLAFAPAGTMNLTGPPDEVAKLTNGIYSIARNFDPISHIFVGELLDSVCNTNVEECKEYKGRLKVILSVCSFFTTCKDLLSNIDESFFEIVPEFEYLYLKAKEYLLWDAIVNKSDLLFTIADKYFDGLYQPNISTHVGTVVYLRWADIASNADETSGLSMGLRQSMFESPDRFPVVRNLGLSVFEKVAEDHRPIHYRRSVEDVVCDNCNEFRKLKTTGPHIDPNATEKWLPQLNNSDQYLLLSSPADEDGNYYFGYVSNSTSSQCFGWSTEMNPKSLDKILAISCFDNEQSCVYEEGKYSCREIKKSKKPESSCNADEKEENTQVTSSINYFLHIGLPVLGVVILIVIVVIIIWCKRKNYAMMDETDVQENEI